MKIWGFRWKRFAIVTLPAATIIFFPVWYRWVNPDFYADVRCVKEGENGEIIQAIGDDCFRQSSDR